MDPADTQLDLDLACIPVFSHITSRRYTRSIIIVYSAEQTLTDNESSVINLHSTDYIKPFFSAALTVINS